MTEGTEPEVKNLRNAENLKRGSGSEIRKDKQRNNERITR